MPSAQVIPFRFEFHEVRTLLIDDQLWFVANDVALALMYNEAKDMTRNLDEDEKGRRIVPTLGGDQEMLVINQSGLYSAILRSRKPEAKRFKKWVTAEVLPAIRKHGRYEVTKTCMTTTIGTDGFHCLGAVLNGKVRQLPAKARQRAKMHIWSQVHKAFSVVSAQDIPAEQLDSARNFIAAYVLEGEWLPKEEVVVGKISWPVSRWKAESMPAVREQMNQFGGAINVTAYMLYGPSEFVSPTLRAIVELEKQGHDLEACRLEVLALKHHLEESERTFAKMRLWAENAKAEGFRFKLRQTIE